MKKKATVFTLFFLLFSIQCTFLFASDVIYVSALNSRIIVLQFDDGYVRYHKYHEPRSSDFVVVEPLDIQKATAVANYQISCKDGFYGQPKNPVKISRKSKGTEFTWICESWSQTVGCVNTSSDHAKEHWIYLHLSEPLEQGKVYTISTGDIAGNGNEWIVDFNIGKNRTEAIHVNLVGYDSRAPKKYGYIYHWGGENGGIDFAAYNGNKFYLMDINTGEKVFSGTVKFRRDKLNIETYQNETPNKNYLGSDVYECDFSSFSVPGEYCLAVEGVGNSFPFKIKPDALRPAYYTSIRGLYHNRSGIELKPPFTSYTRPAPQNPLITPGFSGKLKYTTSRFVDWKDTDHSADDKKAIEDGILGAVDTWGWYQDAGDWDGYFHHMKIPAMLMLTWEIAPANFADGELNLPEGKNNIPDILDEARWLIRFFHRTRHELMEKGFGSGGIGSRVAPDWYGETDGGVPSYEDPRQWIISGEDPFTTFFYSGLAAHYALVLKKLGIEDLEGIHWQNEAEEAYNWALNNTRTGDTNPDKVHGNVLGYFKMYAAATLFRLTGELKYESTVVQEGSNINPSDLVQEDQKWGIYSLITGNEHVLSNIGFMEKVRGTIFTSADQAQTGALQRACRNGGNMWMPMVIGQATTPMIFELLMGHYLSKSQSPARTSAYEENIFTTADYFLGCNPMNMVYITHVGVRYPERLLHLDSWYSPSGEMIPGITPYGPWRDQITSNAIGPWDVHWPYKTLYPSDINLWPGHERWFNNYTTPVNAEFTVHQNTVLSAIVYGYLCNIPDGSFQPNIPPTIQVNAPADHVDTHGNLVIETQTDDPNGLTDIAWVEFYNDWHKIGESNSAPFSFTWKKPRYGTAKISARAVDKSGFTTKSDTLEIRITPLKYDVSIVVIDSLTNEPVNECRVVVGDSIEITGTDGKVSYNQIPGLLDIQISRNGYKTLKINQLNIYSDSSLVYRISPVKKKVGITLVDNYTGMFLLSANLVFNGISKTTDVNGNATFSEYNGTFQYSAGKTNYLSVSGSLTVLSDTVFQIPLKRSHADVKFVLLDGNTPVQKAKIYLNSDSLQSNTLGIARFSARQVEFPYDYQIKKDGYYPVNGLFKHYSDTTLKISMVAIPLSNNAPVDEEYCLYWPNPVESDLNILASRLIKSISVTELTGREMIKEVGIRSKKYSISFSDTKSGTYLLIVDFETGETEKYLVIKK